MSNHIRTLHGKVFSGKFIQSSNPTQFSSPLRNLPAEWDTLHRNKGLHHIKGRHGILETGDL